jgi:hypothetical protein
MAEADQSKRNVAPAPRTDIVGYIGHVRKVPETDIRDVTLNVHRNRYLSLIISHKRAYGNLTLGQCINILKAELGAEPGKALL